MPNGNSSSVRKTSDEIESAIKHGRPRDQDHQRGDEIMRVEKFDDQLVAALRTLGFKVADDKETAEIEAEISIIHPAERKELLLQVTLPNGHLVVNISHSEIINAVEEDAS